MDRPSFERELASEIRLDNTGRVERLTYIGSGTTCLVYQTDAKDIIKEFAPLIDGKPTMSRKNGCNDRFTPIEGLTPFDLGIVEERRAAFDSEITIIDELNCRYRDEEDNMFLIPKDMPETSLGRCHWCNYVGGRTLETVFAESKKNNSEFQQHFLNVLPFIISLYDEIAFYHGDRTENASECGILNLDVKPENLFAIKSQGDYIGIRNLDFGSARRIDDKREGDSLVEPGLISLIRSYASENKTVNLELLIDQIGSKFFTSSPGFYDKERIGETIQRCIDSDKSTADIVSDLKLLDILAAWKTLLFALSDSTDLFMDTDNSQTETETEMVYRVFAEVFENNPLTSNNSLFESYNIYSQLYEIMARSFKGKRRFRLTASEIADRLRNILCVLNGIPDNKKTEEQRDFEAMNRIFSRKDELLASHGLKTIKDILDFCKINGLKKPEKMGDLHWFLMFGEKHK